MSAPIIEPIVRSGFRTHNPDVLTCIANLSNDEVFTPPTFANQMLDTLEEAWAEANDGASIWADSSVTFLDPFTKSGVFLREITRRLTDGLQHVIPDLDGRVDHILTKQVFGIGITHLTSLLARRSLYCSKDAAGKHSIAKSFDRAWGNVWFERTEHAWAGGKLKHDLLDAAGNAMTVERRCRFCGAPEEAYDRGGDLESYAYAFIHTDDIKARIAGLFGADMQFDVIIGNPPYQLETEAERRQARPIYQKFVQQAKALQPRHVVMVTPSRWMQGGMGLGGFRAEMLGDGKLRNLVDYIIERDAFPVVNANGGVSYFLWDRDRIGKCVVTTVAPGGTKGVSQERTLDEFDIFVRRNEAVSILRKVDPLSGPNFGQRVSSISPFGLPTNFHGVAQQDSVHDVKFYGSGRVSWIKRDEIVKNVPWVDQWKVLVAAATDGNEKYPLPIWDHAGPFVAGPGEACSHTYLVASLAESAEEAQNIVEYMRTRFFRFMVSLRKVAQHNKAENFQFVPDLPTDAIWTDKYLFDRYGLTDEEIGFIESQIRYMEFRDA